ncbi:MAG: carboxymuconolactone decarboxylase family protein [Porticoccaceae bacterium]
MTMEPVKIHSRKINSRAAIGHGVTLIGLAQGILLTATLALPGLVVAAPDAALSGLAAKDQTVRREQGLRSLSALTGTSVTAAAELATTLERENGALGTFAVDFVMGEIWSREQLSRRDRNLVVLAILGAIHQTNQLAYYVPGGIRNGLTAEEIREVFVHLSGYAGFPRALDAMAETNRLLAKMGHPPPVAPAERLTGEQRRARSIAVMTRLSGQESADAGKLLEGIAGKLGPLADAGVDFAFGEIWARPQLSRRDRSLLVVSVLAALGRADELDIHVPAALRHGVTKTELEEVMLTVFAYAGAPLAVEGIRKVIEHTASP